MEHGTPQARAVYMAMGLVREVIYHLSLYSVQFKNMYSHLNSSLKLSDSVHDFFCQQSFGPLYRLFIAVFCSV